MQYLSGIKSAVNDIARHFSLSYHNKWRKSRKDSSNQEDSNKENLHNTTTTNSSFPSSLLVPSLGNSRRTKAGQKEYKNSVNVEDFLRSTDSGLKSTTTTSRGDNEDVIEHYSPPKALFEVRRRGYPESQIESETSPEVEGPRSTSTKREDRVLEKTTLVKSCSKNLDKKGENTRDSETPIISYSSGGSGEGSSINSSTLGLVCSDCGGSTSGGDYTKSASSSSSGFFARHERQSLSEEADTSTANHQRKSVLSGFRISKAFEILLPPSSPLHIASSIVKGKMDHEDLIAELPQIEKLSNQERLRLAHKRRMIQLKKFQQYDKEIASRKHKMGGGGDLRKSGGKGLSSNGKPGGKRIKFRNSIMLLEAAGRNDVDEVRRLLSSGVSPDVCNEDGLTALHQCCIDDNEEMMKLLLDYGANVNSEDSERWTPLHAAATCGHLHLVKYLIAKGANLLAVNAEGNMPYDICDEEATLDYIESEMAKRGVTQELIEETRALPETQMLQDMHNILSKGGDLECRDVDGATPLHIAAANGYYRVVELLLDNHVATDVQDKDNWQPIHAAACWGHLDVLELLVQNGADLNARTRNNETPYAICEDPEIKERIIQLRSEQETKQQEAARQRRLRRTQSSNSRTQSIRRTSQRDKGLTSKRDTANEAQMLMAREISLKDTSPSPTTEMTDGTTPVTNHNLTIETSSEEDSDVGKNLPPAAFGRGSVPFIASNDVERMQLIAAKGGANNSESTTINNNLKPNNIKNNNINSNINNHSKQFASSNSSPVTDTNANLPKPEINPPIDRVQKIGASGISLSGSRDSLTGVGNSTIDIHVSVTINTNSPSSTLTNGGTTPYISTGITPGSTLLTPPGTLADLKKHRSLIRTTSNPLNGVMNDLPPKYEAPPSPTVSLKRFTGDPTEIVGDYADGGKKCCTIV